ncbi:MAG: M48 family metallopeptidase [Desulfosudaceae bacterium]
MDFFEQQDRAKSRTGLLVVLFVLAVVFVIFGVYAAIMGVVMYNSSDPGVSFYNPELFLVIAGLTLLVIFVGSFIKIRALSSGGSYVAEGLGGRLVDSSTTDPDQRQLLNVVEEMAIASGVPVPPVYLLENEDGINAFAAGFSPNDAVIGVTRGCCRRLSRGELQGVIAHEFSHVLNGDMRLNIRLIGFLGGIMVIAGIGTSILRGSFYGGHRRRSSFRSSGGSGKGGGGQVLIIAVALLAIGYIGVLIGRLIQSAVSRQREYLADASAVQFTRDTGIANALKKIGGLSAGSKIKSPAAGESCHMFFGKAVSSLFATHPPLEQRIKKIEPGFSGDFADLGAPRAVAGMAGAAGISSFQAGRDITTDAASVMKGVGRITPENVAYSAAILIAIPEPVKNQLRDILGAWAVVGALLLDRDPAEKTKQLELLGRSAAASLRRQIEIVDRHVRELPPELRLPVLDMAVPTLRQMSPEQFADFTSQIQLLIEADSKITIFEFVVKEVINHRLEAAFAEAPSGIDYKNIAQLRPDAAALLAVLARAGHPDKAEAGRAFQAAAAVLPIKGQEITMPDKVSFQDLHTALDRFSRASFGVKKVFFDACCQSVLFDGKVAVSEAELLRAVAYAVDIPVPPFLKKTAR